MLGLTPEMMPWWGGDGGIMVTWAGEKGSAVAGGCTKDSLLGFQYLICLYI